MAPSTRSRSISLIKSNSSSSSVEKRSNDDNGSKRKNNNNSSSNSNSSGGSSSNNSNKKRKHNNNEVTNTNTTVTQCEENMNNETIIINKIIIPHVQNQLQRKSNPIKAKQMQKYIKNEIMPMYGINKSDRVIVEKSIYQVLQDRCNITKKNDRMTQELYKYLIKRLWNLSHREEKYLAIDVALYYKNCITYEMVPIYESMLRETYMWWDLCDPIATNIIGKITLDNPIKMKSILYKWINDNHENDDDDNDHDDNDDDDIPKNKNIWIRRTAILSQLKHKEHMDTTMLYDFCTICCKEKEFFLRKAIGWILREYSKTNPKSVQMYLLQNKTKLSKLSYKEGSKYLLK